MKTTLPLKLRQLNSSGSYYKGETPVLCSYLLHDFFSFPQDTPQITLTISTEPMEDSYEVKMPEDLNTMQIHHDGDWNYTIMYCIAKKLVKELCKEWNVETLFVSLEY